MGKFTCILLAVVILCCGCAASAQSTAPVSVRLSHGVSGEALSGTCVIAESGQSFTLSSGAATLISLSPGVTLLCYSPGMIPVVLCNVQPGTTQRSLEILMFDEDGNDYPLVLCDHPPMDQLKVLCDQFNPGQ